MFKPSLVLLAVVAMAAGLGPLGCGDSGEAAVPLSKAEFIEKGDAICAETDKKQEVDLKAYMKAHPEKRPSQAGQEKVITAVGLPPIKVEAEELRELGAPDADVAKIEAIVTGIKQAVAKAEDNLSILLDRSSDPFAAVDSLARDYGFKACDQAL
jgi:hypothetical protein